MCKTENFKIKEERYFNWYLSSFIDTISFTVKVNET